MRSLRVEPGTVARHASDLAGHCQRCPDGFCRGNCDGGGCSSSESTDVDNTNNGDTKKQISDETEGDETGDDAQLEGQSEEEQQNEGTTTSDDKTVVAAAEGEQAGTAAVKINNEAELSQKLQGVAENQSGSFQLMQDLDCNGEIFLNKKGSNITLDLNGYKIKHSSNNKPLFSVSNSAEFTITDSNPGVDEIKGTQPLQDQGQTFTSENYGKNGKVDDYDNDDIPTTLTYYVTKSSASGTSTAETLETHTVNIKGAIVSTAPTGSALRLINVYNHGKFNLRGGTLTQKKDCNVGSLIYAENGSTVNMSGGFVCGATSRSQGAGIELKDEGTTLNLTGGVIAGNYAPNGGGVYSNGSSVSISENAVISGNATFNGESDQPGYGGGIMAVGGIVTVSGGYITNNKMAKFCSHDGNGDHGGAGLAANNGANVTISGGQITGNYSEEAGGGVYVTDVNRNTQPRTGMAWLKITGGIIASNVSYRSEGAGIRVGQMVDAMINGTEDNKVYITNNHCMSRFDWGGGGIFVQGNSDQGKEYTAGRLFIYNSYISANEAGGYGGGVAVCPTGKTLVTNTEGTAIFGNSSAGAEYDDGDRFKDDYEYAYNSQNNTGNEAKPHLSGGGSGKNQDIDAYKSKVFRDNGHADFFLAAAAGHQEPLAAVIGKMLGDGDAKYSGSKERSDNKELSDNDELYEAITIPANGGVKIYRSVGLKSAVKDGSDEANNAQKAARTFITGNYSWDHGGGIMSNGDLYLGVPADTYVYPSLKLKATKKLAGRELKAGDFTFTVYRKDSSDPIARGVFTPDACTKVGTASNDASGIIKFDLGEQFTANGTTGTITYYLVENAGTDSDITYDPAVYEITVKLAEGKPDVLMSVPILDNATETKQLTIHNYTINGMTVTKHFGDSTSDPRPVQADSDGYYYVVVGSNGEKTFTNKYNPYTSSGSWTPKATKVVEGGEMKEFTLEFADNENFTGDSVKTVSTSAGGGNPQTKDFPTITYTLDSLKKNDTDVPGRGASKTFTYYMCEKDDSSIFSHYKFDNSVYKFTVVATDDADGNIGCKVTYRKGTVGSDGKWANDDTTDHVLTDDTTPTFTNTYSTSLPLSGMSGVTLTYLAGAAVLCAAAAWMHIRRKANAKGGERRE